MASDDKEREFRLKPVRPKRSRRDDALTWADSFGRMMHFVRMSRTQARGSRRKTNSFAGGGRFNQRCAVRVTYTPNKVRGQWAAHGRYLARESATHRDSADGAGFGHLRHPRFL